MPAKAGTWHPVMPAKAGTSALLNTTLKNA